MSTKVEKIRIAIFEDNDHLRDSQVMLLNDCEDFLVTGSYAHCNNLIENIQASSPDVVIMDINLPGVDGIQAVQEIRKKFPAINILMQTVFEDEEKVFAAIKSGATGYLLKNAETDLLMDAVREIGNGGAPMTPSIARKVLLQFQQPVAKPEEYHLSGREKEVLELLVKGLSYKMIADKLNITYDTVRAHMKKIYEKLHVTSMTEAVAKAINQNLFK